MAQIIAKVGNISGEAFARDASGNGRRLKSGDVIREGETVVASEGALVQLKLADGREMTVRPGEVAKMDAEVAAEIKPDATDSAVANNQAGFQKITQALSGGSDLDSLIEDPAAGAAGAGSEGGHSFVELLRVVETVDPLAFQFGINRGQQIESIVQGPVVVDQTIQNTGGTATATATATVSITISAVNDAPVANPDTLTALEDTPIDIYNNGDMWRDFTYVEDLVRGIRLLVDAVPQRPESAADVPEGDSLSPAAPFRVVNIGNSDKVRLSDFVEAIEQEVGKPAVRNYLEMQKGDVPATWADASLLERLTGFRPQTDIREGVKRFVAWYRDYYSV